LDLTGNKLTLIPPSIVTIDSLEKLEIGSNPNMHKAILSAAKKGPDQLISYLRTSEYGALYQDVRMVTSCALIVSTHHILIIDCFLPQEKDEKPATK
jgi:hypothetical protein